MSTTETNRKFKTPTFRQEVISACKSHKDARNQDIRTDWLTVSRKVTSNSTSVLRTIGIFPRRTSVRDMHVAFQIPYVYDYITKSCRQQVEVIQNHENENVRCIGQGEARQEIQKA
jgi:hypothetical protein